MLLTSACIVAGLVGAGAMFSVRAAAGVVLAWPGIVLLTHAGWAMRCGAIRARLNRKQEIGDPDEHRWVVTVWNADILTLRDSPGWFRIYVGAELAVGTLLAAPVLVPVVVALLSGTAELLP